MSECFIQTGVQKMENSKKTLTRLTTTNAFTETLKFISTSQGFGGRFEKLALSSEKNLKYF